MTKNNICLSECLFSTKGEQSITGVKYKSKFEIKIFCIQENSGQSVKGVSAGSTACLDIPDSVHASRENARLVKTPAHKQLFIYIYPCCLLAQSFFLCWFILTCIPN